MRRTSVYCFTLVLAAAIAACGCGGSSSGGGTLSTNTHIASEYVGVYRNTSGPSAPNAGQIVLILPGNKGKATLALTPVGGEQVVYTGKVSGKTVSVSDGKGNSVALALEAASGIEVETGSLTLSDGTTGLFTVGTHSNTTVIAPSQAGTYTSTSGESGTLTLSVDSGLLTGTATDATGKTYPVTGAIDIDGAYYLAYDNAEGYEDAIGSAEGTETLAETPSQQMVTLDLHAATVSQDRSSAVVGRSAR